MPRKRKIAITAGLASVDSKITKIPERPIKKNPIVLICEKVQTNESIHGKCIKELHQIYIKMKHDEFMAHFLRVMRAWMRFDELNSYANVGLIFMAKYIISFEDETETPPIMVDTFDFLLSTVSPVPNIRFRIVQFVNLLMSSMSADAALDDKICTDITAFMTDRLKDYSAAVRVQAVQALQRLQVPENPDDAIVRLYIFHLANDSSAKVRQAVISSIGRNYHTIPSILERLWDVDERVRRHTYLQMSSFPVKQYKVVQRITMLEQGLNDHSEPVRKVVTGVLLPQWLQSYNKNFMTFLAALKLDANEEEYRRFMCIAKDALFVIFKSQNVDDVIESLPLANSNGIDKCIPYKNLTVEMAVYWLSIVEYLQRIPDEDDRIQDVICELSDFCNYVEGFTKYMTQTTDDRWTIQENQYKFFTLVEILLTFDLGDEIGRQNLKNFITNVFATEILNECVVEKLVRCIEYLIPDQDTRLQYFIDIIRGIIDPSNVIDFSDKSVASLIETIKDPNAKVKISALKLKILDLREQESIAYQDKNYAAVEKITEDLMACNEDMVLLLNRFTMTTTADGPLDPNAMLLASFQPKKLSLDSIQQCLQICYFAVASKKTYSLTPNMCKLYRDFIRRQMESKQMIIRDWALKCGTSFSMLYEQLAKDVYTELYNQFYKHHSTRIWATSITATFELIDRYGFDYFEMDGMRGIAGNTSDNDNDKSKRTHRQLYNKMGSMEDQEDEESTPSSVDLMYLFGHFLETLQDTSIIKAIIIGFCRLVLSGQYTSEDLVSKLLLRFFNPNTESEINQILGIFFETLNKRRRQECLQKAMMHTLSLILEAPIDSPLHEIKPEQIIRYIISSTRPVYCAPGLNIHNEIAVSFMKAMSEQFENKELLKLLSKELLTLEVSDEPSIKEELKATVGLILEKSIDSKTELCIKNFHAYLSGTYRLSQVPNQTAESMGDPRDHEEIPTDDEGDGTSSQDNGSVDPSRRITNGQATASDLDEDGEECTKANDSQEISIIYPPDSTISSVISSQLTQPVFTSTQNTVQASNVDRTTATTSTHKTPPAETRRKQARDRSAPTPGEGDAPTPAKVRKTASGRRAVSTRDDKNKSNVNQKTNKDNKDGNDEPLHDAAKENILHDTNLAEISSEESIPASPDAFTAPANPPKKILYQTKDLIQSPKMQTPQQSSPKSKRKLVESNVMVRLKKLSRQSLDRHLGTTHRTRNALVAEYKNTNVMTRNRLAVDQIKSPTRRVEHIRRVSSGLNKSALVEIPSPVTSVESPRRRPTSSGVESNQSSNRTLNMRSTQRSLPKSTSNVSPVRPMVTSISARNSVSSRSGARTLASDLQNSTVATTLSSTSPKSTNKGSEPRRTRQKTNPNPTEDNQPARLSGRLKPTNNNNEADPVVQETTLRSKTVASNSTHSNSVTQATRRGRQLTRSIATDRPKRNVRSTSNRHADSGMTASLQLPTVGKTTRTNSTRKAPDTTALRSRHRTRSSAATKK